MQERRGRRLWCREQAFGKGLGLGQMPIWMARVGASMSSDDRFGTCCGARARCRHVHARSGNRACYTFDMPATPATSLCRELILMYSQRRFIFLAHISKLQTNAKDQVKAQPLRFAHHAQAVVGEVGREVAGEPKHVSGTPPPKPPDFLGRNAINNGWNAIVDRQSSIIEDADQVQTSSVHSRFLPCKMQVCCSAGSHAERADAPSN